MYNTIVFKTFLKQLSIVDTNQVVFVANKQLYPVIQYAITNSLIYGAGNTYRERNFVILFCVPYKKGSK